MTQATTIGGRVAPIGERVVAPAKEPEFLTVAEAALRLAVDTRTIYRWIQMGQFPHARFGLPGKTVTRIPAQELAEYIRERTVAAGGR